MEKKDVKPINIKLHIKKRPIKKSIGYLVLLIILAVAVGFGFYTYIYKSNVAFLAIPIIIIAGIFLNTKGIINIIDFIFNTYTVTTAVCTEIKYKYDKEENKSDKYSEVYFTDYKTNNILTYKFKYRVNLNEGSVYKITRGRFSNTYVAIFRWIYE